MADTVSAHLSCGARLMLLPLQERAFPKETGRMLRLWAILILLGGIDFGLSLLPIARAARPLVLLPALPMIALVAVDS